MLKCQICKDPKPEDAFYRHGGRATGRQAACIECMKKAKAASRAKRGGDTKKRRSRAEDGSRIAPGFERVTVACWNAADGCNNHHDFIVEKGSPRPRYVCPVCNDTGYERGSMLSYNEKGNAVTPQLKSFCPPVVRVYRPGDAEFARIAQTVTPIAAIYSGPRFGVWSEA